MSERSARMPTERPPGSRAATGSGGAIPEVTGVALDSLLADLRSRGVRITTPRREILAALLRAGDHATVEDVATLVQERAPDVHLSTVYRTLDSLTELGVVEHVHFAHGAAAYHLAPTDHRHLVCERCGTVIDVPAELLAGLADEIDARYGFELRAHHFGLSGRCATCRDMPR